MMKRAFANNAKALTRSFRTSPFPFAKVVLALEQPPEYARDSVPMPSSKGIDFTPGEMLGVSGELGLRPYLEAKGHTLVVTSDLKDGDHSVLQREIVDAEIVISQPFWPAYITKETMAKSPNLKHAIIAGLGPDNIDIPAAIDRGMTVSEVSFFTRGTQACYSAGVREILECHFEGRPIPSQYLIVQNGVSAGCFAAPSEKLTQVIKNIQGAVQTPAIRNVRPTMVKYGTRLEEVLERKFPLHVEQRKQMWVSGELEAKQVCEKPAEITREPNFWLRCMSLLRWQAFSY